jgi:hypothetical protein
MKPALRLLRIITKITEAAPPAAEPGVAGTGEVRIFMQPMHSSPCRCRGVTYLLGAPVAAAMRGTGSQTFGHRPHTEQTVRRRCLGVCSYMKSARCGRSPPVGLSRDETVRDVWMLQTMPHP